MNAKFSAVMLLLAGLVIGVLAAQIVNQPAQARDFRARSTTNDTQEAQQQQPQQQLPPQVLPPQTANQQQPQQGPMNARQFYRDMEPEEPVQRYETFMVLTPEADAVIVSITDTRTGVARIKEIRTRTAWQEVSYFEY